ncbi:helix-turn-helix domain-containing protein [Marinomonas transparens]|uniref:Helix-turn-helix transcriptional regulator n=1 Tax=Marinomonas transparens TaxID=2795388 RepID=A0A934JSH8_9GAMM|nr:AraC family transcriptional regulator [Marinomonas transparens]MBJ7536585.1 helix-turn-helix transcriptional regulator [Marinomonas transparens]
MMSQVDNMQRKESDSWLNEVDDFNARMTELDATPSISVSDQGGMAMLAHARFSPFEGEFEAAPFLMLTLCTANIGRMHRSGEGPSLEGVLRPGTFTMALPNTSVFGSFPGTEMLGIAVNLSVLNSLTEHTYTTEDFIPAASQLHKDVYLSSVMNALWRDAELHGLSSAFFEQGLNVILQHLSNAEYKPMSQKSVYSLSKRHLETVLDYIESRVCSDVSVTELATLVGQDTRSFTRSFSMAIGYTPYVYFTLRRMEYAKRLLCQGNVSITDVAISIGYSNPSKFSAAFRRTVGVTPNTWRKEHSKQ